MPTLKFVMNVRADNNMNTSTAMEFVVDDESEAEEAGRQCFKLVTAFSNGFGAAGGESA